ncbi:interferon-related developmental regulator 1 [Tetranychus urticae]|uniref:Interferon-related developmental regulator N-terminal domain-containing protein n=1 Tax=Tetranychus urticae TaxID=32264 RepID=T1K0X0_TETUR|nr:interferon-related developmental regulator 1 [Tetranychus urticae]
MAPSTDSKDECCSLYSMSSSRFEEDEEGIGFDGTNEEPETEDDFKDKLVAAMDATYLKAAKARVTALAAIRKAFVSRYALEFVSERRSTICDIVERCIKKGKGEEQGSAALLAAIVCVSLGSGDDTDAIFNELKSTMMTILMDKSVGASVRSHIATSLGLCCFIAGSGSESCDEILESLHTLFSASYFKGNGVAPNLGPETTALHAAALYAWSLLCTIQPASYVSRFADKYLSKLIELLDSSDVELRIAAGETIAVIFEICREARMDISPSAVLTDKLRQLATDSQKFRAKKDRKKQRSSFRDVLKFIEDDELPSETVKFGRERLFIDSWCRRRQYDAFCHVLGSGMNLHLKENDLLRDVFELGPPLPIDEPVQKISKFQRKMENIASFKARTKSRGKQRDKKVDVLW